jgi:CheY-like chemotaxis protein
MNLLPQIKRVLYIEDEDDVATAYIGWIRDNFPDVEIFRADTYNRAIELLKKLSFGLVVSDLYFPGKEPSSKTGGIDLFRFIVNEFSQMPIHFLSGSFDEIKGLLEINQLPMRPTDKIFPKGDKQAVFAAFGREL